MLIDVRKKYQALQGAELTQQYILVPESRSPLIQADSWHI